MTKTPTSMSELEWLREWFSARGELPACVEDLRALNYFEAALIDSLGVIDLITDIEERYQIAFSSEDFLDRRFSTVGGLADMLAQRRDGRTSR
jgi:acyl carrier protein